MLKVTERLLIAKPELLAEYVEVAKAKGTRKVQSDLLSHAAFHASLDANAPAFQKYTHVHYWVQK